MQPEKGEQQRPSPPEKMLSFTPQGITPVFASTWDHRPTVPSPLSSSPIRASSPLSPINSNSSSSNNTFPQRLTQSSPIQPPKFRYASRPSRPNPVMRRREQVQEDRRKNFFNSVKQKSEERAWQRRDIEGQSLKSSWLSHIAHVSHDAPTFTEADIEDAVAFSREEPSEPVEDEEMMLDNIPEEEDEELEALIASYEEQQRRPLQRRGSLDMSDDEMYEDVFAELLLKEQHGDIDPIYMDHDLPY